MCSTNRCAVDDVALTTADEVESRVPCTKKVVVLATFQIGCIKRIWSSNLYDVGTADVLIGSKLRRDEIEDFDVWSDSLHGIKV